MVGGKQPLTPLSKYLETSIVWTTSYKEKIQELYRIGKGSQLYCIVTINRYKLKAIIDLGAIVNAINLTIVVEVDILIQKKRIP